MGKVDQLLGGGRRAETQAHDAAQARVEHKLADPGHMDEIKKAIRDVRAEDVAAEAQQAHDAEHARLRQGTQPREPEQQPREAMPRGKGRLQKILFGADR